MTPPTASFRHVRESWLNPARQDGGGVTTTSTTPTTTTFDLMGLDVMMGKQGNLRYCHFFDRILPSDILRAALIEVLVTCDDEYTLDPPR